MLRDVRTLLGIDVRALAATSASVKMSDHPSFQVAALVSDEFCMAWIARLGVIDTIDRRIASSFSL